MVPVSPTCVADMPSVFWKPDSDTIWISSPSRIHDTPSPRTTDQWNFVHGSRSMRAGTRLLMAPSVRCATASLIPISFDPNRCEPSGQGARRRVLTAGVLPHGPARRTCFVSVCPGALPSAYAVGWSQAVPLGTSGWRGHRRPPSTAQEERHAGQEANERKHGPALDPRAVVEEGAGDVARDARRRG